MAAHLCCFVETNCAVKTVLTSQVAADQVDGIYIVDYLVNVITSSSVDITLIIIGLVARTVIAAASCHNG